MKHAASVLEGALLDLAFAVACGGWVKEPRLRSGRCEVYDNPCGGPGPCWGWWQFSASTLGAGDPSRDISSAFVRYGELRWRGNAGPDLIAAMRAFVTSKLGSEIDLPDVSSLP